LRYLAYWGSGRTLRVDHLAVEHRLIHHDLSAVRRPPPPIRRDADTRRVDQCTHRWTDARRLRARRRRIRRARGVRGSAS
jgi:hypothetical protein